MLVVGGLVACISTTPPPVPSRQSTIALEVKNATLQNGLRVVHVRDPRAADVQVTMQYRVGSIDDPAGQEGMAHLVEHMMFQQVLGASSLAARLEDVATNFNATTRGEVTTYTARARPERLDELLSVEAVRVGFRCTSISDAVFEREREVVVQELRLRDSATQVWNALHTGVYPEGHPYRRMHADTPESVAKITRDQACIFADLHYTTTNAVLVVSGNVTPQRVDEALNKFLGRVQKRETLARPMPVAAVPAGHRATVASPFDQEAILFTWPLPLDPGERLKVRTAAKIVDLYIDSAIRGSTAILELGDERAPVLCIAVFPRGPQGDIVATVTAKLAELDKIREDANASWIDKVLFDLLHQKALVGVFAGYEQGSDRDEMFATELRAGRDPDRALGADSAALRSLTFSDTIRVLHEHLNSTRMGVVMMKPRGDEKTGVEASVAAPVHDIGQRRDLADPADAKSPEPTSIAMPTLEGKRERTLPNGLHVILLPITSVPTVEVRLVFRTGTADEPANRRGAGLVAARALEWPAHRYADFVNFALAGATRDVIPGDDSTTFVARGLDMHIDYLLTGLARWVREGSHDSGTLRRLRELAPGEDADRVDAWMRALYSDNHPYVRGGFARHISPVLTMANVLDFYVQHYTPRNATLVIAGKFDAPLAERWVEHLFADWEGGTVTPTAQRAMVQPISLALDDDLAQTHVDIALPATGRRPVQLVLAQMLDQITDDIRHQLAASYGFDAELAESRLASEYVLAGTVDAARTGEALQLVQARVAALREDPEAAARAFVVARKRVLTHLGGLTASAHELAVRVQADVTLGRPPLSDAQTASEVQALTIDQMTAAIAALDLSHAAILMRGPAAHVDAAYAALGRTPRRIPNTHQPTATKTEDDDELDETFEVDDRPLPVGQRLTFSAFGGYGFASARRRSMTGYVLAGEAGYRVSRDTTFGLHGGFGQTDGTYKDSLLDPMHTIEATALQVDAYIQATPHPRLWASAMVGLGLVRVTEDGDQAWQRSVSAGLQGGVDVLTVDQHRAAVYLRLDTDLFSDTSYYVFSLGVGYRH